MKISLFPVIFALPLAVHAGEMPAFPSKDGTLTVPQLTVDGAKTYYNAQLRLDFDTGTFTLQHLSERPKVVSITLGRSFSLKGTQYAMLPGSNLAIHFLGAVEDSRCPIDVLCIQAGEVTVGMEALYTGELNGGEFSLTLGTEGADNAQREIDGYRLTLLEVSPTPRSGVMTSSDEYSVVLRLDAISSH